MTERTMWGIHAGKTDDADSLFLKKNFVALGWLDMGDIGKLPPDRESFKDKVRLTYPDWRPGHVFSAAGQLYRFVHEMKVGDIVVYPSKRDRHIHIGEIVGEFQYRPELQDSYPQTRPVKWYKHVPRTSFSQGALYETGSALSFFQIKNYADEFLAQLQDKKQETTIRKLVPQNVLKNVCSFYNVRLSHLKGASRTSNLVLPRQIAMFLLRNHLKMKLEEIAFFLNRKDHTTVIHATNKVNRLMTKDPLIKRDIDQIIQSLSLST